jgi:hypothetical protein
MSEPEIHVFFFSIAIAGLAVTYALGLHTAQSGLIWCFCDCENELISVERILQYISIPAEPPLVIEANRPDHSWPSHGEVDIDNLQVILFCLLLLLTCVIFMLLMDGYDAGPICPTHATCAAWSLMHFPRREENWYCWENRQR